VRLLRRHLYRLASPCDCSLAQVAVTSASRPGAGPAGARSRRWGGTGAWPLPCRRRTSAAPCSPLDQFFTLAEWSRHISIMGSMLLVDWRHLARLGCALRRDNLAPRARVEGEDLAALDLSLDP
jgi:hypothetical protein